MATSRGAEVWTLPGTVDPPSPHPGEPVVRLLPVWENYLLGYEPTAGRRCRSPTPTACRAPGRPAAHLADGRSFGHWHIVPGDGSIEVVVEPFSARLPKGVPCGA